MQQKKTRYGTWIVHTTDPDILSHPALKYFLCLPAESDDIDWLLNYVYNWYPNARKDVEHFVNDGILEIIYDRNCWNDKKWVEEKWEAVYAYNETDFSKIQKNATKD